MIIIYRTNDWQLVESPQLVDAAWQLAEQLTEETGIPHQVGRI
jgi:hypothetical protein